MESYLRSKKCRDIYTLCKWE